MFGLKGTMQRGSPIAIRSVDKLATRPIFVLASAKDPRFHGIRSGIQDVAMDSAEHPEKLRNHGYN